MSADPRRLRIRHRLFGGFAGVLVVTTVLTVLLVSSGLRGVLNGTFQEELARQLALGEWALGTSPLTDPDALAREITRRVGYRISLISPEGEVLGDSYVEPELLADVEDHSDRPEVVGALAGEVSFAQRTSRTVSEPLLYGAKLVTLGGEPIVLRVAAPLTDIERAVDRAQNAVYLGGLFAMMAALVMAYWVSGALSRPLVRFVGLSRRLSRGEFAARVPSDSGVPELDELALALNRLTEELENRLSELRQERDGMEALIDCLAEGVVAFTEEGRIFRVNRSARDILQLDGDPSGSTVQELVGHSTLRQVLAESAVRPLSAREVEAGDRHLIVSSRTLDFGGAVTTLLDVSEIRRLEQVRRDFVANASHELKTPLTSIRGFAETLIDDEPPEDLRARFLESIRANSLRLQHLVDDLLDLSRLESGGWVARLESVDVGEVAQEEWRWCAELAEEKNVRCTVESTATVFADRSGLGQIFRNLLENALRHSDPNSEVRVTVTPTDSDSVRVEVIDEGEGIPTKSLPRIFERFYRADSSRAREIGGTGLGLAIVKHLVEGMGGTVEADSIPGRGTTIRFVLPSVPTVQRPNAGTLDAQHDLNPTITIAEDDAEEASVERSLTEVFR